MKTSSDIFFYFERLKETISIVYDNTQFSRDCEGNFVISLSNLFYNF